MGRGRFTEEEMNCLLQNPYVADVSRTSIAYSREFKQLFMEEYTAGRRPVQIFRDAGFDIEILGSKRIERACARWKESYESGTLGSREAVLHKGEEPGKQQDAAGKYDLEQIKSNKRKLVDHCREQEKIIRMLKAEVEFFREFCRRGIGVNPEGREHEVICQIISDVAEKEECRNCVTHLCEIAGISRSLYYQYKRRRERSNRNTRGTQSLRSTKDVRDT